MTSWPLDLPCRSGNLKEISGSQHSYLLLNLCFHDFPAVGNRLGTDLARDSKTRLGLLLWKAGCGFYTEVVLALDWTFHMTRHEFCSDLVSPSHLNPGLPLTYQPLLYFHCLNWIINCIALVLSHAVQQGGRLRRVGHCFATFSDDAHRMPIPRHCEQHIIAKARLHQAQHMVTRPSRMAASTGSHVRLDSSFNEQLSSHH
jgi:hypothetical protein